MAKRFATDACYSVADRALQVLGGRAPRRRHHLRLLRCLQALSGRARTLSVVGRFRLCSFRLCVLR